jgi:DNA-binding XRE family transcriptional regulator
LLLLPYHAIVDTTPKTEGNMNDTATRSMKEIRQELGVGVRRLAKGAPVSPRTVISIEKGGSQPQIQTIRKISRFLAVDPMGVTEFRTALEAEGLTALPDEEPQQSFTEASSEIAGSSPDREQMVDDLKRRMRDLGRFDADRAYRQAFEDEPPRA